MTTLTAPEGFCELEREALVPNPNQPRKHFEQDALQELAESIKVNGLIQPITVRPMGEGTYQIVAGERRWRAAGIAGIERLPCRVMNLDDEMTTILAITENVARRDMDPMEEAQAFGELVRLGKSNAEIARLFGKSENMIFWTLELLKLIEPLQFLVAKKQVSLDVGCYFAKLTPENQQAAMKRLNDGEFKGSADAIKRYCVQVEKVQQQGGFGFALATDPITETRRKARRSELEKAWEKVEGLTEALTPFMEATPEDLAFALAEGIDVYMRKLDVLATAFNRVRNNVRDAAALAIAAKTASDADDGAAA